MDIEEEKHGRWIPGYEGMYSVTKDGDVWSFSKKRIRRIKKRRFNPRGSLFVTISRDNRPRNVRVELLMFSAFFPNFKGGKIIHVDGDKANNSIDNLEYKKSPLERYNRDVHGDWVPGHSGRYSVSKSGIVWSFLQREPMSLRRFTNNSTPYPKVSLCKDGKLHQSSVHCLVMETYVGERPPSKVVCHNNGNPEDCRLENLRYDSQKNNCQDTVRHGNSLSGERNPSARLSNSIVRDIKRELSRSPLKRGDQRRIARSFGVSDATISAIKTGSQWSTV